MARAFKWSVAVALTVATFGLAAWLGTAVYPQVLPSGWPDAAKIGAVFTTATLLATVAFGIARWWAERNPSPPPKGAGPSQQITGPIWGGGGGATGNNVGRDLTVGFDPRINDGRRG